MLLVSKSAPNELMTDQNSIRIGDLYLEQPCESYSRGSLEPCAASGPKCPWLEDMTDKLVAFHEKHPYRSVAKRYNQMVKEQGNAHLQIPRPVDGTTKRAFYKQQGMTRERWDKNDKWTGPHPYDKNANAKARYERERYERNTESEW